MNKSKFASIAAMAAVLACATGCISTKRTMIPGNIVASTKPVEQGQYTVLNGGKTVTGKYKYDLLKSKDITGSAMKAACDEALSQCPGADALVDIKTDTLQTSKTLLLGLFAWPVEYSYTTFVTGVPVKTNK